jgi:SAM-dependent methyltransferase
MPEFTMDWYISYAVQVVLVVLGIFFIGIASMFLSKRWGAPWVISDEEAINRMLELANLKEGDIVVDLGAGDGRVLIQAVKNHAVTAVGYEIDPIRYVLARFFIWRRGLSKRAKVLWKDVFQADFSEADAVVMYLTREANVQLRPIFEGQLKPGTLVVSNAFPIPGWTPLKIDNINLIFVYEVGRTDDSVITEFV